MRVPRLALAAGGTVALLVLGLFDPSVSAFFPKCPFLLLTGLQCPGCGKWYAEGGYEVNPPEEWEEDLEEDKW